MINGSRCVWLAALLLGAGCAPTWKPTTEPAKTASASESDRRWVSTLQLVPDSAQAVRGFAVGDLERAEAVRPFIIRPVELEILRALGECGTEGVSVDHVVTASGAGSDSVSAFAGVGVGAAHSAACVTAAVTFPRGTRVASAGPDLLAVASGEWTTPPNPDRTDPEGFLSAQVPEGASMWMVLQPRTPDTQGSFTDVKSARMVLDLRTQPQLNFELHATSGHARALFRRWRRTRLDRSLLAGIPAMAFIDHEVMRSGDVVTLVARGLR